jgi:hypothetical protein
MTDDFASASCRINAASLAFNERNDCCPKAVALATGTDYEIVHRMMKVRGRRSRCCTKSNHWMPVVEELGFELIDVRSWFEGRTARTLIPELPSRGTFLVRVTGHIFCVRDGQCSDWSAGRKKRITHVWKVRRKNPENLSPGV